MPHRTVPAITYPVSDRELQSFANKFCVDENECWIWHASIQKGGEGQFHWTKKRPVKAHRYAYELFRGTIESGGLIDHLCRTRACVNPNHLEVVTHDENLWRGFKKLNLKRPRRYWCMNKHQLTERTIGFLEGGYMYCLVCTPLITYTEPEATA